MLEKIRQFEEKERKLAQERDQMVRRNSVLEERENSLAVKEYRLKQQEEDRITSGNTGAIPEGQSKLLVDIEGRVMALADLVSNKFGEQAEATRRLEQDIDDVQAVTHGLASIFVHKSDLDTLRAAIFTELTRLAAHIDTVAYVVCLMPPFLWLL